jgi:metal-responsive CopG/Arc/MetJ family transcriptional regulator
MTGGKRKGAGRPAPNGKMETICLRLPKAMVLALDEQELSRSEFIRVALKRALKKPAQ